MAAAEDEKNIVPFLQRMKKTFGIPVALVHDMGRGLLKTPLVKNLQNPDYMKILLTGKTSLAEVFAEIEIDTLREEFRKATLSPDKISPKIKRLIAMPDYPEKLVKMVEKAVALS